MSVDFPRAWQIARSQPTNLHHEKCSYRQMRGGLLCDCEILTSHAEYQDEALQTAIEKTLYLPLKAKWFYQIKDNRKPREYRLKNEYWEKRLVGKDYTQIILTLGYPKRDDHSRRIIKPWLGYEISTITSEEWNNEPKECFAIIIGK